MLVKTRFYNRNFKMLKMNTKIGIDLDNTIIDYDQLFYKEAFKKRLIPKKMDRNRISHFTDGGWSFSSFGGVSRIKVKFEAFAHQEYNKNEYINEEHLKKSAELGTDIFYRDVKKKKIDKNFFPKDLLKLMEENPEFYFGSKATL